MEIAKCNYESRWALEGASALKNCNQESFFKVQAVITSIEMKIQGVPKGFVWFAFQIINEDSKDNHLISIPRDLLIINSCTNEIERINHLVENSKDPLFGKLKLFLLENYRLRPC